MGFLSKIKLLGYGGAAIIVMVLGFYLYFQYSQNRIEKLSTELATISETYNQVVEVNKQNQQTIQDLNREMEAFRVNINNLYTRMDAAEEYSEQLEDTLNGSNLTNLAANRSTLIEKRVNDATEQVFQDIESITTD